MKKLLRIPTTVFLFVIGQSAIAASPALPQVNTASSTVPALYFYPAPYKLANGSLLPTHLTVAPEQITTLFPVIREMSGVTLVIPWSELCPVANHCNFSIIDKTLSYWGPRKKKVILNVSTMGPPIKTIENGRPRFVSETPEWVLQDVSTYLAQTATFGVIPGFEVENGLSHMDTVYPTFGDPRFVSHVASLVRALGKKYDGNPVLSYVRISSGKVGEENPIPPGSSGLIADQRIPGFSTMGWIQYCEQMTNLYEVAFHRTQLEFDISFLPVAYVRGSPSERAAIDTFIKRLQEHNIFIAFNGLESADINLFDDTTSGPGQSLRYLMQAKRQGKPIGLEGQSPMAFRRMQDVSAIAKVVRAVAPNRLVFFGLDAGAVNHLREGSNPSNATTEEFMSRQKQTIDEIGRLDQQLLELLGYTR
jgi:hypothetical protein